MGFCDCHLFPLLPCSLSGLVSSEEGAGHKLSPARRVPTSTGDPTEIALPGASCFHLKGNQASLPHFMSGGLCFIHRHGPALCKGRGTMPENESCSQSEDYDLPGGLGVRQKKPRWILTMACVGLRNLEGCSSLHNMDCSSGLCLHTPRDGELTTYLRKPILSLGSSTVRKLLLIVMQHLSDGLSPLLLDQCSGATQQFSSFPHVIPLAI